MTWLDLPTGDPFGLHNLPYGACARGLLVRVGSWAFDLTGAEAAGLVDAGGTLQARRLNPFLAGGRPLWTSVRRRLVELLTDPRHRAAVEPLLSPVDQVALELPFDVADYVDFYSSQEHATNLGRLLRPDQAPLLPNWKHLPIGYHGRAGTVVVSGTGIVRPCGQRATPDGPVFGPSVRLDIEAEVGFVIGVPSELGAPLSTADLIEHVFGAVLVNDWSARDIQAWEYQPLGPFLGKSFATSVSPWVVPLDALAAAKVAAPAQDPPVRPYLTEADRYGYDIRLEVRWNGTVVSHPPFAGLYWTPAQQLAHLTVNGASVRTGDLYASGTVSGPARDQVGSFMELTWGGTEPVTLADGSTRDFLADGDTVTIAASAPGPDGSVVGLGEVTGRIRPAAG
jgi:fumarylacetoacetase